MKVTKTAFEGLLIIEPEIFDDSRGYFFESYNKKQLRNFGIDIDFVQDNQSRSVKNVIRGLHFQTAPHQQVKLVRILQGTILDIAVDLRRDQPTFKQVFSFELSAENKVQIIIPKGFAHGFSVLSDAAEILYKSDDYYHPECASGVIYNDPELNIDWKINDALVTVSDKDKMLPKLSELPQSFF
jgi:dTDP-4-dehydrorhamnose 3,5-epimerase